MRPARSRTYVWLAIGAFLVVGAIVVAATIGGRARGPITVRSADGVATLTVDPGALPQGTSGTDLGLRAVSLDQVPALSGFGALAGYELRPDGLRLGAPARLELRLRFETAPALLFAIHVSGERSELTALEEGPWDADLRTVTLSVPVSHFSSIFYYSRSHYTSTDQFGVPRPGRPIDDPVPLTLTLAVPTAPVLVGNSFQVAATVTSKLTAGQVVADATPTHPLYRGRRIGLVASGPWSFRGEFSSSPPISRPTFEDEPPWTSLAGSYTVFHTFRCESVGDGRIGYQAHGRIAVDENAEGFTIGQVLSVVGDSRFVTCVAGATVSPTATATAPATVTPGGATPPPPSPARTASPTSTARGFVCGLPGGPTCPPRPP